MSFQFTALELPEVLLIEPHVHVDERGFFMETFQRRDYAAAGITDAFIQENHSLSTRGTVRGLHFQRTPKAQGKLVRVVAGEIYDVAVDIRVESSTFGRWVGVTLSAANRRILFVPPWCAHGFCVVSGQAEVVYKTTAEYAPELEAGVAWNDADLGIPWPVSDPLLSARDGRWPSLRALELDQRRHADPRALSGSSSVRSMGRDRAW